MNPFLPHQRTWRILDSVPRFESLQVLRGLAALAVVLCHCELVGAGWLGVDLFFCLSGFLITHLHARDIGVPSQATPFALKRLIRIYPPLFVLIVGWVAMHLVRGLTAGNWNSDEIAGRPFWIGLAPTVFMLPTIGPGGRALMASWTLAYEMMFYVAFGLAILGGRKAAVRLFWSWMALVIGFNLLFDRPTSAWGSVFNANILEFLIGTAAARISVRSPLLMLGLSAASLAVLTFSGLILNGGLESFGPPLLMSKIGLGLVFSTLILGATGLEKELDLQMPRTLVQLGDASYSLYLIHLPIVEAMIILKRHAAISSWISVSVTAVLSLVAGLAFYRFVEKPLLDYLRVKIAVKPSSTCTRQPHSILI